MHSDGLALSQTVLDVLADKWTHLVICAPGSDSVRFGELNRRGDAEDIDTDVACA
jgi:DNA-binding HxlR family transcriptional regulator